MSPVPQNPKPQLSRSNRITVSKMSACRPYQSSCAVCAVVGVGKYPCRGWGYARHDNLSHWFSGAFHLLSLTGLELHVDQTNWMASSQDPPASASYVTARGPQVCTVPGFWRWQRLYQLSRLPNPLPMNFELISSHCGAC